MLHVVTKTASQKLPRVRTRETEQTDECCIVSHKHRTSGSSSTYVTHDMVPRSLDHSTPPTRSAQDPLHKKEKMYCRWGCMWGH